MSPEDVSTLTKKFGAEPTRAEIRKWPQELKNRRRTELHCQRMARFRNKRAAEKKTTQREYLHLEQKLQQRIAMLLRSGVCEGSSPGEKVQRELQRLVLEREMLREENNAIRLQLVQYQKFALTIQSVNDILMNPRCEGNPHTKEPVQANGATVRRIESTWRTVCEQTGKHVYFPKGKPTFFFHPFSRQEFDAVLRRHDKNSGCDSANLTWNGNYLGWNVYHGAVTPGNKWLLDQIRCVKRMNWSLDSIVDRMSSEDGTSKWPIMPTARDIGAAADIDIQTLQRIDENAYVIVRSYSGSINYRCMCLVQRSQRSIIRGKRVQKFYYVLADTDANSRSRNTESTPQDDVQWIVEEGRYSLTLQEVDDTTTNVVFDSLGCFQSEQSLSHFIIMFGHIVTR